MICRTSSQNLVLPVLVIYEPHPRFIIAALWSIVHFCLSKLLIYWYYCWLWLLWLEFSASLSLCSPVQRFSVSCKNLLTLRQNGTKPLENLRGLLLSFVFSRYLFPGCPMFCLYWLRELRRSGFLLRCHMKRFDQVPRPAPRSLLA